MASVAALDKIHIFRARNRVFREQAVLQENVICHYLKGCPRSKIEVRTSDGHDDLKQSTLNKYAADLLLDEGNGHKIIRIPESAEDAHIMEIVENWHGSFQKNSYFITPVSTFSKVFNVFVEVFSRWVDGIEDAMGEEVISQTMPAIIASVINRIPIDSGRTLRSAEITTPFGVFKSMSNSRAAVKREFNEKVKQAVRGKSTPVFRTKMAVRLGNTGFLPQVKALHCTIFGQWLIVGKV